MTTTSFIFLGDFGHGNSVPQLLDDFSHDYRIP